MKKFPLFLAIILIVSLLTGCAGTPVVYYTECTCPANSHVETPVVTPTEAPAADVTLTEGALKTGLAISTSVSGSKSAADDADGEAKSDVLMAAVLVDDHGVIQACIIDGISSSITFNAAGEITSDLSVGPQTKNELGDNYGMRVASSIQAEWNEQVAAIAEFAVGKTVEELEKGAVSETGKAPEGSDLATSATMYTGSYVDIVKKAVANAQHLGAQSSDTLKMATITGVGDSASATAENAGNAQLNVDVTALTMNGDVITSCYIDAVQAKVAFDAAGAVTSDVTVPVTTKNEQGYDYGMVKIAYAKAEWFEQAASFAAYVTGKTAEEVAGIAITEATKPAEADLAATVSISVIGFMNLIVKACQ